MNQATILDIKINLLDKNELLAIVEKSIEENSKTEIFTINNEFIVDAQSNEEFKQILNSSDINIVDSTGIVWALKKQEIQAIKLPGADMFIEICKLCKKNDYSIYLLGGIKNAGSKTASALKLKFTNIRIVGITENIDISTKPDPELIAQINEAKPDIIFVALGAPRQEMWIRNNKDKLDAKVFMGVGGTFDYISGNVSRAPESIRALGLEWLYRLIVQPSRYKRIYKALVTFPLLVKRSSSKKVNIDK